MESLILDPKSYEYESVKCLCALMMVCVLRLQNVFYFNFRLPFLKVYFKLIISSNIPMKYEIFIPFLSGRRDL